MDIPDDAAAQFDDHARRYLNFRRQRDEMTKLMDAEKKPVMEILEQYGEEDAKGHKHLPVDPPVHGIVGMTRQRKVTHTTDEVKAEAIARALGLYERLFKPAMVLDEDAVMVAREQGLLTDQQVDQMFPQKVSYALMPEKAK